MFEHEIRCAKESTRFLPLLRRGGMLLDLGANIGEFALAAQPMFNKIVAIEAHPDTAKIARKRLPPSIIVINLAVAVESGARLWASSPNRSTSVTVCRKQRLMLPKRNYYRSVVSVGFNELLKTYKPSTVKMDIEGSEWEVFESAVFNKELKQLLIEFHGTANPVKAKLFLAIERLIFKVDGFERVHPRHLPKRNDAGGFRGWNLMTLFTRK